MKLRHLFRVFLVAAAVVLAVTGIIFLIVKVSDKEHHNDYDDWGEEQYEGYDMEGEETNQETEVTESDSREIKNFVHEIWYKLCPLTEHSLIESTDKYPEYFTESFSSLMLKGYDEYLNCTDEVTQIGIAEIIYGWWGGQDPNPDGEITDIKISKTYPNEATVHVKYQNWPGQETEEHTLYLKKINGEWLLNNYDNMRELLEEL